MNFIKKTTKKGVLLDEEKTAYIAIGILAVHLNDIAIEIGSRKQIKLLLKHIYVIIDRVPSIIFAYPSFPERLIQVVSSL